MAQLRKLSEETTFDKIMTSHLRLWYFGTFLPEGYIKVEKLKGQMYRAISAIHCWVIGMYSLPYIYLLGKMLLNASFNTEFICEFLMIISVTMRIILLWTRREQFASLVDECRGLWSYLLSKDEILIVNSHEKIVYYFKMYFLISGFVSVTVFSIFTYLTYIEDIDGTMYRQNILKYVCRMNYWIYVPFSIFIEN